MFSLSQLARSDTLGSVMSHYADINGATKSREKMKPDDGTTHSHVLFLLMPFFSLKLLTREKQHFQATNGFHLGIWCGHRLGNDLRSSFDNSIKTLVTVHEDCRVRKPKFPGSSEPLSSWRITFGHVTTSKDIKSFNTKSWRGPIY